MKKKLLYVLACLCAMLGVLAPASPALADHSGQANCTDGTRNCAHWGNGYAPPLYQGIDPLVSTSGRDLVQDGAYFWQDNHFINGWYAPVFGTYNSDACSGNFRLGAIKVCFTGTGDPLLRGNQGITDVLRAPCDPACNHIYAANVYIDYSLSNAQRQMLVRHEMGHALGLGHTTNGTTVMNLVVTTPFANQHERDAMDTQYVFHRTG